MCYFGGRNSLLSQPITRSDFRGSGRSQSKHWNVRFPFPSGGSAKTKGAPQPGQIGRSAWPMEQILPPSLASVKLDVGFPRNLPRPGRIESLGQSHRLAGLHGPAPTHHNCPGTGSCFASCALRLARVGKDVFGAIALEPCFRQRRQERRSFGFGIIPGWAEGHSYSKNKYRTGVNRR